MKPWLPLLAAALGAYVLSRAGGGAVSTPKASGKVDASLAKLQPLFRAKVQELLARMRSEGFSPYVHEAYRSAERAAELAKKGTGVAQSQHTLGLAVDVLEVGKQWNASAAFWDALHRNALALGLGRVKHRDANGNVDWDRPHVQAMPGNYDARMYASTANQRDALIQQRYAQT